jgi:LacI family transcriptional regulator
MPAARVSLSIIAHQAGVSVATVSRIANGHFNRARPETIERVQKLLDAHDYRPDQIGRALRRGESRIVALLAPNLNNPAMGAIATSTEAALREAGFVMILCDTHDEPKRQDEYLEAMRAQSVQGYVVVSAVESAVLRRFLDRGEPIVLVGRRQPQGARHAPFVGIDNHAAGAAVADHLVDAGCERLGMIHTGLSSSAIADRAAGFMERLAQRGVAANRVSRASSSNLQHLEAGYAAIRALTATGWPDGLFCTSDLMAYGAHRHAAETGIAVPRQCRIVGIDDSPLNPWLAPWLTSVHVPYPEFGPVIVEQLAAVLAGAATPDRLLPHRLVIRGGGMA